MKFTSDWFSSNIPLWQELLAPLRSRTACFLEIGTYEGRCALWLTENILGHEDSKLYCIDNFTGVPVTSVTGREVQKTFMANTREQRREGKIVLLKGDSDVELRRLYSTHAAAFDAIYLDCDHGARHELEDAVLSYALLKPGGLMIFDDNTYSAEHDNTCPKRAIDAFIACYSDEIRVLHLGWQVIIQKHSLPPARPLKFCRSEAYSLSNI